MKLPLELCAPTTESHKQKHSGGHSASRPIHSLRSTRSARQCLIFDNTAPQDIVCVCVCVPRLPVCYLCSAEEALFDSAQSASRLFVLPQKGMQLLRQGSLCSSRADLFSIGTISCFCTRQPFNTAQNNTGVKGPFSFQKVLTA